MNSVQNSPMIDVLEMLEACKPAIYRAARDYDVDADDLTQDLAVNMLEHPRSAMKNPFGYYKVVLRSIILLRRRKAPEEPLKSLDEPMYQDSLTTLADTLSAGPVALEDHSIEDRHASIVYAALQKLPLEEQEYFCSVYGITAYTPTDTGVRSQVHPRRSGPRSKGTICVNGYKRIRRDQELLQAVQETYSAPSI
jgi:DNA-directed RNA polymerase specialized sigma24 family protein